MKKINRLLYSNKLFAFIMLLLQIAVFVAMFIWISDYSVAITGFSTVLSAILVIYEINRTEESTFKMTWITLISIIPIFGALFYIYTRARTITRNIRDDYTRAQELNKKYLPRDEEVMKNLALLDKREYSFAGYLEKYGGSPAFSNTAVQYYPIGEKMYEDMKKELLKAERFIFMEFFIINSADKMWREVLEILRQKVKQGVEVRLMYDAMGCLTTLPVRYNETLERYGIKCRVFSPIVPLISTHQNNRDHRKIVVIDGKTAFSGGINLADEYINQKERFGHWKDTGIMLKGDAVAGYTAMFFEMWNVNNESIEDGGEYINASKGNPADAAGFVIPFGDTPLDDIYVGKRAYIHNLDNASEYTYIMTPYLVIDDEMFESMKYAAQRGVDVKIIMPHIPDKPYAFYLARTYYKELLDVGIEIYEYTPGFVHAKMSISDGRKAIVGTINHDYRSLYLHYECAAYMVDVPAVIDIERDFKDTLALSQKITYEDIKKFNPFTKLLGHVMRLIAPLI
ncbi:MAG: cardiolipin synthase [Firmicutes bacterium]|nr:cardiolipin synthase [Bacillota bacterium]